MFLDLLLSLTASNVVMTCDFVIRSGHHCWKGRIGPVSCSTAMMLMFKLNESNFFGRFWNVGWFHDLRVF